MAEGSPAAMRRPDTGPILPEDATVTGILAGKVAIVRSGDANWLTPISTALSSHGAKVALVAGPGSGLSADVRIIKPGQDDNSVADSLAVIGDGLGQVDILVNGPIEPLYLGATETSDDDVASVQAQAATVYRWCRVAGAAMANQGGGVIVNFVTGLARRGVAGASADSMAQASIEAMTRSLALEWARDQVRINAIGIGWYEFEDRTVEEQRAERLVRYLPLRRKGTPNDVTDLLAYLASDQSGYVTGQTVYVDGGAMAHV
jgi:3-oxoacyl-[acyl-carrier protein] reductase